MDTTPPHHDHRPSSHEGSPPHTHAQGGSSDDVSVANGHEAAPPSSCESCKKSHLKCNGASPVCNQCAKRHMDCHYSAPKKRGPKAGQLKDLQDQVELLQQMVRFQQMQLETMRPAPAAPAGSVDPAALSQPTPAPRSVAEEIFGTLAVSSVPQQTVEAFPTRATGAVAPAVDKSHEKKRRRGTPAATANVAASLAASVSTSAEQAAALSSMMKNSQPITASEARSLELTAFLSQYIAIYDDWVQPCCPFSKAESGGKSDSIPHHTVENCKQMLKYSPDTSELRVAKNLLSMYSLLATGAQVFGHTDHAAEFIRRARLAAQQLFDVADLVTAAGFDRMAFYFLGAGDLVRARAYNSLALRACESLSLARTHPVHINSLFVRGQLASTDDEKLSITKDLRSIGNPYATLVGASLGLSTVLATWRREQRPIDSAYAQDHLDALASVIGEEGPISHMRHRVGVSRVLFYGLRAGLTFCFGDLALAASHADTASLLAKKVALEGQYASACAVRGLEWAAHVHHHVGNVSMLQDDCFVLDRVASRFPVVADVARFHRQQLQALMQRQIALSLATGSSSSSSPLTSSGGGSSSTSSLSSGFSSDPSQPSTAAAVGFTSVPGIAPRFTSEATSSADAAAMTFLAQNEPTLYPASPTSSSSSSSSNVAFDLSLASASARLMGGGSVSLTASFSTPTDMVAQQLHIPTGFEGSEGGERSAAEEVLLSPPQAASAAEPGLAGADWDPSVVFGWAPPSPSSNPVPVSLTHSFD